MRKIVEYYITIRNITKEQEFVLKCDNDAQLKQMYETYKKEKNFKILSMHSMLMEIRPIPIEYMENVIM